MELLHRIRQNIQPAGAHLLQPLTHWQKGEKKEGVSQNLLQRCRTFFSGWQGSSEAGPGAVGAASFVMAPGFLLQEPSLNIRCPTTRRLVLDYTQILSAPWLKRFLLVKSTTASSVKSTLCSGLAWSLMVSPGLCGVSVLCVHPITVCVCNFPGVRLAACYCPY